MRKLNKKQLMESFDRSSQNAIEVVLSKEDVAGIVVFENQTLNSSRLGEITALIYGPGCTYKSHEELEGKHLGDLPSERKYPIGYYEKEGK